MAEKTVESLSKALDCVQQLRTSVCDVFRYMTEGNSESGDDDTQRKQYVINLKETLNTVTRRLHDVEESVNKLSVPSGAFQLGNTGFLSLDPTLDMQVLYGRLLDSYKWTEKVRDYSAFAVPIWAQNGVKRSQQTALVRKRRMAQTSHCQPPQHVDAILKTIGGTFNGMQLSISRPYGTNSAVVQVDLDHVLKAVITFKGLLIEWVLIRGYDEPMLTEDGRVDLWTPSDYHVFRKVSENAQAAMVHYYGPLYPEFSLRSYLTWIYSYMKLFSEPCVKCGSRLLNAMPPTWRDLKTLQPYHEDCKS
ncbi:Mediator of RNA polymerase II transcription subunit 27 [Amphibalanus amphitrite]|uniref:Mediator of RNA polymerase II transcription subunit 27 n=1 Tax=Amphibalanus amphitrite TaxID=1232801 RepID=A0A6A4VTN5_AMPAM|nr:mediator of RNA polymerase II transcription subunit 27-like [Amphibalanus amphitrite]XP_043192723.1 mediator of RNA polymerase II transcription subunit 27-like [Amphibalanus amphitrite]XP_043192724.1 mediator of RNA polymerase II transcription subunit 27-like [Amphibalanus amphitrite]XP_043192725.1 mediator of RNA polymerase II transcription subunit 27-like [Amphibalanus amphitrite]XP_043192726.1 mediator of RNA polymerase II transcription subunit 27-like [Amphibalanus amphitrite]KAF0297495